MSLAGGVVRTDGLDAVTSTPAPGAAGWPVYVGNLPLTAFSELQVAAQMAT